MLENVLDGTFHKTYEWGLLGNVPQKIYSFFLPLLKKFFEHYPVNPLS